MVERAGSARVQIAVVPAFHDNGIPNSLLPDPPSRPTKHSALYYFNLNLSWQILIGTPITNLLNHPVYANAGEVPVCPDGAFTCPGGPRAAFGLTSWQYPLDFHADYTYKWKEKANVKFLADMFNVANTTWVKLCESVGGDQWVARHA